MTSARKNKSRPSSRVRLIPPDVPSGPLADAPVSPVVAAAPSASNAPVTLRVSGATSETFGVTVTGLAAQLMLAVLSHAQELTSAKGRLELDWGPNGVQGRALTLWDATIDPLLATQLGIEEQAIPAASRGQSRRRRATAVRLPFVIEQADEHGTFYVIQGNEPTPWEDQ